MKKLYSIPTSNVFQLHRTSVIATSSPTSLRVGEDINSAQGGDTKGNDTDDMEMNPWYR